MKSLLGARSSYQKKDLLIVIYLALTIVSNVEGNENQQIGEKKQVIFLTEIYSHGATTPKRMNLFNEEYINRLGNDVLTKKGAQQHYDLGLQIRSQYDSFFKKLLTGQDYLTNIQVYSSSESKCIQSAINHNLGLFKRFREVSRVNLEAIWSNSEDINKFEKVDFRNRPTKSRRKKRGKRMSRRVVRKAELIPLQVLEPFEDFLFFPNLKKICPTASFAITQSNRVMMDRYGEKCMKMLTEEIESPNSIFHKFSKNKTILEQSIVHTAEIVQDTLECSRQQHGKYPKKVKNSVLKNLNFIKDSKYFELFQASELRRLYTTGISKLILAELKKIHKNRLKHPKPAYLAFSADMPTLVSFLIGINHIHLDDAICNLQELKTHQYPKKGEKRKKCFKFPRPATNIILEVTFDSEDGQYYTRIRENGKSLIFCINGREYCRLDLFILRFDYRMLSSVNEVDRVCGVETEILKENRDYLVVLFLMTTVMLVLYSRSVNREKKENVRKYEE